MKTETETQIEEKAKASKTTLRVAAYLDPQTLRLFNTWRASLGIGRAEGLKYIIKTRLNLYDGDESALNESIERFNKQLERLKDILNEA